MQHHAACPRHAIMQEGTARTCTASHGPHRDCLYGGRELAQHFFEKRHQRNDVRTQRHPKGLPDCYFQGRHRVTFNIPSKQQRTHHLERIQGRNKQCRRLHHEEGAARYHKRLSLNKILSHSMEPWKRMVQQDPHHLQIHNHRQQQQHALRLRKLDTHQRPRKNPVFSPTNGLHLLRRLLHADR